MPMVTPSNGEFKSFNPPRMNIGLMEKHTATAKPKSESRHGTAPHRLKDSFQMKLFRLTLIPLHFDIGGRIRVQSSIVESPLLYGARGFGQYHYIKRGLPLRCAAGTRATSRRTLLAMK